MFPFFTRVYWKKKNHSWGPMPVIKGIERTQRTTAWELVVIPFSTIGTRTPRICDGCKSCPKSLVGRRNSKSWMEKSKLGCPRIPQTMTDHVFGNQPVPEDEGKDSSTVADYIRAMPPIGCTEQHSLWEGAKTVSSWRKSMVSSDEKRITCTGSSLQCKLSGIPWWSWTCHCKKKQGKWRSANPSKSRTLNWSVRNG